MPATAEAIEVITALLALLAFGVSLGLLWRSWWTYRAAVAEKRCRAVLILGEMRVRNESFRTAVSASVTYSGFLQALTVAPIAPTSNRPILQVIWLLIALVCLAQSALNERDSRRVIRIIEAERLAGRMRDPLPGQEEAPS